MTPDRHERASRLFLAARGLAENARAAVLNRECGEDVELRAEVESLLEHDADGAFLEAPSGGYALHAAAAMGADSAIGFAKDRPAATAIPEVLDGFRILRLLGEGGMGVVYLAEQERPRRQVALKVIRSGWLSSTAQRRFEHEVNVLGRLQHPGIAQIYESGTTRDGKGARTYFTMEYVDGAPLTHHARLRGLDTRARLEMIVRVCEAVQHAHQKGVIHRDLKPGNILVGSSGEPKIVDFGVARLIDPDASRSLALTQSGQFVGTLAYMSPEQLEGRGEGVDTRSDVYALGLVLYELLAGRRAHAVTDLGLEAAARTIRSGEPPALGSIVRTLRGDLETIVAKALEKEPARRYQSAAELGADIRRYLTDEPIFARPASRMYQLRKFARRNRAVVITAGLVAAALIGGVITTTWQASRAGREAARARREADRATAVSDFVRRMFASIDPYRGAGEATVAELARRAAAEIDAAAAGQPELEAALRYEVGVIFYAAGLAGDAEQQYRRALELRRRLAGDDHRDTIAVVHALGLLFNRQGRFAEAEPLLREAFDQRRVQSVDSPETWRAASDLSMALMPVGRIDEAEALCSEARRKQQARLGSTHTDTLATQVNLASILRARGRLEEAADLLSDARRDLGETVGPEHPSTLLATANLAQVYKDGRRYAEAEPLYRTAREGLLGRLGAEHPDTLVATANLAQVLWRQKKAEEANDLYREVVPAFRRVFGTTHPSVLTTTTHWALALKDLGRPADAESLLAGVWSAYRQNLGAEHERTRQVERYLNEVRVDLKRAPDANVESGPQETAATTPG